MIASARLLLLSATIALQTSAVFAGPLFEPQVPDEISVFTVGRDTKKYWTTLTAAKTDPSLTIREDYKKKLSANIRYQQPDGSYAFSTSKIRITGDWKDHLDTDRAISSLSVDLKNENIGNIVKFRLLLPKSRNGVREIFWSVLMEELGYPVPFRKMVTVNLNDYVTYEAIFEEAAEKEFLERFGFRESPIVEVDERQHWANVAWRSDEENCLSRDAETGECDNGDWSRYETYKVDNAAFLKNTVSSMIALRSLNVDKRLEQNYDDMNRLYALHGLDEHNRKRIYDPMYGVHIPVYFDGDVLFPDCDSDEAFEFDAETQLVLDRVVWKYELRSNTGFTLGMRCVALEVLEMAQKFEMPQKIALHRPSQRDLRVLRPLKPFPQVRPEVVGFDPQEDRFEKCEVASANASTLANCRPLDFAEKRRYLAGNGDPYVSGIYDVFPAVVGKLGPQEINSVDERVMELEPSQRILNVPENTTIFLKVSPSHGELDLKMEHPETSRVVIYNSDLSESFTLTAKLPGSTEILTDEDEDSRYDERLLTSCITFLDTTFNGGRIEVAGGGCEDSLNFMRATGFLAEINVQNAFSDAIDADFSSLDVHTITVAGAGNDCLDLSAGHYNIAAATLTHCGDKGVSAGERARVTIGSAVLSDMVTGVASKDTSRLHVAELSADRETVETCAAAYRKKQEYNGAELIIERATDCDENDAEAGSQILIGQAPACKYFSDVNGIETCVTKDGLRLQSTTPRPLNYAVDLTFRSDPASARREDHVLAACHTAASCEAFINWSHVPAEFDVLESSNDGMPMTTQSINLLRLGYAN